MRKRWQVQSIRNRMFLWILFLMLMLTMVVSIIFYRYMYVILGHETETDIQNSLDQIQSVIDDSFRQSEIANAYIYMDTRVKQYFDSAIEAEYDYELYQELFELVQPFRYTVHYVRGIGFYSQKFEEVLYVSGGQGIQIMKRGEYEALCDYIDSMTVNHDFYYQINDVRTQYSMYIINKSSEGAVMLSVDMLQLKKDVVVNENEAFYMISEDGSILCSSVKEKMGEPYTLIPELTDWTSEQTMLQKNIDGKRSIICTVRSENYDWSYLLIRDVSETYIPLEMLSGVWCMIGVCVLLGVVYALFLSKKSSKPLEAVMSEFGELQSKALQYQINPHFLFNTLNLIGTMAVKESGMKNDVFALITKLSKILRYSLEVGENFVSLKKELEYARLYIEILEKRHAGMLTVYYDIPEELLGTVILRFSVQPLVENAVYHGIQPQGGGTLRIRAMKRDANLLICVCDDGVGMEQSELEDLNEWIHQSSIRSEHIGLANVHRRIQILFGEEYGVTVKSTKGAGTEVWIQIPCYEHKEDNI